MTQKRISLPLRRLKELKQNFLNACRNDVPGLLAARTYAQAFLGSLQRAFDEQAFPPQGWTLIAVGGFGRGELSYASDLDLLFLYRSRIPLIFRDLVQDCVYGLWDDGFEVGHVTASVSNVKRLASEDFTILTSYLETQFIAGDKSLYRDWRDSFLKNFGFPKRRRFLQNLIHYRNERLFQYGESSYLIEPHIKEGVGGLRDLHVIRWAGSLYLQDGSFREMIKENWLTQEEELWLEQAYDFLWRVRLQLHQLTGRRQDQLLFAEQEQIAGRLGFMDSSQGSAVEAFMRLYYRHTARIRRTTSFFLERVEESQRKLPRFKMRKRILPGPFLLEGNHLHFLEPEWISKDPRLLMRFFWQAARSGAHFHHHTGHIIRENLSAFAESARRDPIVVEQFVEILLNPVHSFTVLKVMLETRFLDAFLPEFSGVRYRVQHDVYHLYTVDEHLLRTVREIHHMEHHPEEALLRLRLSEIFARIKNRRVLLIAALLHDIGKGQGKNHAAQGAAMAKIISERLALTQEETDLLRFLIENHLLLAETALKRDLMDEKPVLYCTFKIGTQERLQLLYLLTIADSRATGPGAWNTWKASLLRELYVKIETELLYGGWGKENIQKRSEEVQGKVLDLVKQDVEKQRVTSWLDALSVRYLLSQRPEAILQHYYMEKELAGQPLSLHAQPAEGDMWQITVATRDRPGLFALITGVLWVCGLNILSADIFTRQTGIALDVLIVERLPDPLHPVELWDKVEKDLMEALHSRSYLDALVSVKRKPSLLQQKVLPRKEDRVLINEEASDFYTIIEVYTWDRPGILHAMTNALYKLGISIQLAKISTPGAQVADVFYVTDLDGNKLLDPDKHEKIRKNLLEGLDLVC